LETGTGVKKGRCVMNGELTPVMPVGGNVYGDSMNGCTSFMWIFGLLILLGLFNGGGFGTYGNNAAAALGYENLATSNEVQRGFDAQNSMSNQREILAAVNNGTAQAVAATNQSFHDNLAAMQSMYNETARDIAALAVGQANLAASQASCCSETKQLIMQMNYDNAMRDAATNANFTSQIQGVKDMMYQNKIEGLQYQVSALNTEKMIDRATAGVVRYPMNTMYAVGSPCFGGCPCN
jgi:hypothetical protein